MLTYRYRGHSMSDPAKYRTREEVQKMRTEHDPIEQVRVRILEKKLASEDELKKIDAAGARHRQRGGRIRHQRSRAGCRRALDRRVPLSMQSVSTILVYLAFAGAIASWIAGAVFCARTLAAMPGNRGMMCSRRSPGRSRSARVKARGRRAGRAGQQGAGRVHRLHAGRRRGVLGLGQSSPFREVRDHPCR